METENTPVYTSLFEDRRVIPYLTAMAQRTRYITLVGLPQLGDRPDLPLESLFVEPSVGSVIASDGEERHLQDGQPATIEIGRTRQVALLGEAGSGKSMLILALILGLCQRAGSLVIDRIGPLLPLPIILRDLRFKTLPNENRWQHLLNVTLPTLPQEGPGFMDALPEYLAHGQVFVMVDGWDEIPVETRKWMGLALDELRAQSPKIAILVTSRPLGWQEAPYRKPQSDEIDRTYHSISSHLLSDFNRLHFSPVALPELYLRPFRWGQIETFVDRWFRLRVADEKRRTEFRHGILEALRPEGRLRYLARIPNLLTLMCLIYKTYVHLPDGRGQLYEKIAEAYLESIPVAARLPALREVPLVQKQRWLGLIARAMQLQRVRKDRTEIDAGTRILYERAQELIVQDHIAPDLARDFLTFAAQRAGLLLPRTETELGFAHLSFQEYFTAAQLIADIRIGFLRPDVAQNAIQTLKTLASHLDGHETVVLAFELIAKEPGVADGLLRMLGEESLSDEMLAELYYDQATGLSQGKRDEIWQRLRRKLRDIIMKKESVPKWVRTLEGVFDSDECQKVEWLRLDEAQISQLDWLSSFSHLTELTLPLTPVADISPIFQLKNLKTLLVCLDSYDLSLFSNIGIDSLYVFSNKTAFYSLSALTSMQSLTYFGIMGNSVIDWESLVKCTQTSILSIINRESIDLINVQRMNNLKTLMIHNTNAISLSEAVSIKNIIVITLRKCNNISFVSQFLELKLIIINECNISDITPIKNLSEIIGIELNNCPITSLRPLKKLKNLRSVVISNCPITDTAGLEHRTDLEFDYQPMAPKAD